MNKSIVALAAGLSIFSLQTFASPTVQLSFTAAAEPPPCHIQQAPGTLDFGNIQRSQLNGDTPTQLPVKPFVGAITIQCEGDTSIGLSAVDNSGGSAITVGDLHWDTPATTVTATQTDQRFGLGMTLEGKPIGVWNVVFHSAQVDGVAANIGIASNGILDVNDSAATMRNDGKVVSWVQNNAFAVGEIFTVQADAAVAIAPIKDLASGSEIDFAGSATLEIKYL
ncbi:DUF1120 domain-containing protein [Obesumbacterium proteus]|uniref:DUF1120 domain-containing protein n=1 Tax=Obesumbacterium proteus TaxID=82983 RepID=UPI0024306F4B|nr:DUF1120 domain-containing protein [Obesumbacterium proteus]